MISIDFANCSLQEYIKFFELCRENLEIFGKKSPVSKGLMIYYRSSPKRNSKINDMQQTLGHSDPRLKLKFGVDHQLSSQYESLDRLFKLFKQSFIGLNDTEVSKFQYLPLSLKE